MHMHIHQSGSNQQPLRVDPGYFSLRFNVLCNLHYFVTVDQKVEIALSSRLRIDHITILYQYHIVSVPGLLQPVSMTCFSKKFTMFS